MLVAPGDVTRFRVEAQSIAPPAAGEVRVRHQAIGTNFLDIYHRKGLYPLPNYPAVLGVEAAGMIEEVGCAVEGFKAGDRVAYAGAPVGTYSSVGNVAAERLIRLPDSVSAKTAAASLLKGMTAHMLLQKVCQIGGGDTVLVQAAAGGLGSVLVRAAKSLGATVIGTVSSKEKADLAKSYGADHLIVGRDADVVSEVKRLTDNRGVDVAYDGIGGDMLIKSIRSVKPWGTAITIGQAAGPIPPVAVEELRPGKSLSHPSVMAWCADIARYQEAARMAVKWMEAGIGAHISGEYALAEVVKAHEEMESGRSAGSILLLP
jgi:NADPH2:quinone reductase